MPPSPFGPLVSIEEYEVVGSTVEEIRASMDQRRPYDWDAYTVLISELTESQDGPLQLKFGILVSLPRLAPGASDEIAALFAEFRRRLEAHERHHVEICRRSIPRLRALAKWRGSRGELMVHIERIKARADAASVGYDARTGHGMSEGVMWPPP